MTNEKNNTPLVTALFNDRQSAECAYNAITTRGYDKDDVNLMMSDETREKYYSSDSVEGDTELGSKALEGSGVGAGIGGTVGAIIGAIAAIGTSVVLPGLGLIIAGPLAGALVGAGAGGLTGGLIGALVGSGIPEETAKEYETGIKSGGTVLGISPRSSEDAAFFQREWEKCGGTQIYSSFENSTTATTNARANTVAAGGQTAGVNRNADHKEAVIPVTEEQLHVGKREVETGGVKINTHVEEKPVEETVRLREEHVTVDRRPANREVSEQDAAAFKEGTYEVTERSEQPIVGKEARVVEEIVVGKDVTDRTETVRDTVRRTDVDVDEIHPDKTPRS